MKRISILLFFVIAFVAKLSAQSDYQYLTMIKLGNDLHITTGADKYEKLDIKAEQQNKHFDLSPVHKRVAQYETEGWEFVSSELDWTDSHGTFTFTVTLRREE